MLRKQNRSPSSWHILVFPLIGCLVAMAVFCNWFGKDASNTISDSKTCVVNWFYYMYSAWNRSTFEVSHFHQSILFGMWMMLFTWMITYLDSNKPGIQPPSPVSPKKLRLLSGHTFHMGYVLALLNGVTFAVLSFNTSDASL